jgi:hypothetical protein
MQSPLLGWELKEEVSDYIDKIMDERIDYQRYNDNIRKIKLAKFPYSIYYLKDSQEERITVLGLFHFKRNPDEIKAILS